MTEAAGRHGCGESVSDPDYNLSGYNRAFGWIGPDIIALVTSSACCSLK